MQKNEQLVLFNSQDGNVTIDVTVENDTVWLSINQLTQLFDRDKSVISRHLKNIFAEQELNEESTVAFFATVQIEGGRRVDRQIEYYNLDAILSVGYRVNSKQATNFRRWANSILKDYLLKGYALNKNIIDTKTKEYQNFLWKTHENSVLLY
ncbi:MAG TPA: RhuM family protein [Aquella sp.]|nr:RhuM family protein [Aquella sp.]